MMKLEDFLFKNNATVKKLSLFSWYGGVCRYLIDSRGIDANQIQEIMQKIKECQLNDGGFRFETVGTKESVVETAILVDFLLDLGEPKNSKMVFNAIKSLITRQQKDGGFAENPEIRYPIEWDDKQIFEKQVSTPHVTAWVLRALLRTGLPQQDPTVAKALRYLSMSQKTDGGWSHFRSEVKSSPYFTALISIALGKFKEVQGSVNFVSLKKYFIDRQKEDGSIGDCLDASLLVAEAWQNMGINTNEKNMRRLLKWIQKQQNSNGSFVDKDCGWPATIEARVNCSMNVSRVLHRANYGGEKT